MAQASKSDSGRQGRIPLSPVIHGRARLLILSLLLRTGRPVNFTALRDELATTDGSLSVHLGKLAEAELISIDKTFVGKKPQTRIRITATGRARFRDYVGELKAIVPGLGDGS